MYWGRKDTLGEIRGEISVYVQYSPKVVVVLSYPNYPGDTITSQSLFTEIYKCSSLSIKRSWSLYQVPTACERSVTAQPLKFTKNNLLIKIQSMFISKVNVGSSF